MPSAGGEEASKRKEEFLLKVEYTIPYTMEVQLWQLTVFRHTVENKMYSLYFPLLIDIIVSSTGE